MSPVARLQSLPLGVRRLIVLSGLLLVLILVWLAVALPVGALASSQQEWRADMTRQIARDRGMAKNAHELRAVSEAVRNSPLRGRLFEASALGVDNQLQNELRTALLQSGVEPTTFKALPGKSAEGLTEYRVEFSSVMSADQLRALFTHLSLQPHYVRIERLRVDAPQNQRPNENPKFTVLMEAKGFAPDTHDEAPAARIAHAN